MPTAAGQVEFLVAFEVTAATRSPALLIDGRFHLCHVCAAGIKRRARKRAKTLAISNAGMALGLADATHFDTWDSSHPADE